MRLPWNREQDDAVISAMKAVRQAHGDGTPWLLVRVQDGKAMELDSPYFAATQDGQNTVDEFFHRTGE